MPVGSFSVLITWKDHFSCCWSLFPRSKRSNTRQSTLHLICLRNAKHYFPANWKMLDTTWDGARDWLSTKALTVLYLPQIGFTKGHFQRLLLYLIQCLRGTPLIVAQQPDPRWQGDDYACSSVWISICVGVNLFDWISNDLSWIQPSRTLILEIFNCMSRSSSEDSGIESQIFVVRTVTRRAIMPRLRWPWSMRSVDVAPSNL